ASEPRPPRSPAWEAARPRTAGRRGRLLYGCPGLLGFGTLGSSSESANDRSAWSAVWIHNRAVSSRISRSRSSRVAAACLAHSSAKARYSLGEVTTVRVRVPRQPAKINLERNVARRESPNPAGGKNNIRSGAELAGQSPRGTLT